MSTKGSGFTLVEMLIVVGLIAIISTIVVPNMIGSRIAANEAAAISTLRNIVTSQLQVLTKGAIDSDGNGIGEYGYFQELSGERNIRNDSDGDGITDSVGSTRLSPPALSRHFGLVDSQGLVRASGYMFRMYLPGIGGEFLRELPMTQNYASVSGIMAANYWVCYAWPSSFAGTGRRAFFVNQEGQILSADNYQTRYSGLSAAAFLGLLPKTSLSLALLWQGKPGAGGGGGGGSPAGQIPGPKPSAAFLPGHLFMNGSVALNAVGQDGNLWTTVQ